MAENARTILVVGGGIAGTTAALHIAGAGHHALLIDEAPVLGGSLILLDKTFPTDSCGVCFLAPNPPAICPFLECADNSLIEIHTLTKLAGLEGESGAFRATLISGPHYVDPEHCTACGKCAEACPVTVEAGMLGTGWLGETHKAIYLPCPQAVPHIYVVDPAACNTCAQCQSVCPHNAIDLDQKPETTAVDVDAVILAPGFSPNAAHVRGAYGYGEYKNVITSLEFERMLSTSSPSQGRPIRPSDGQPARRIAIIHCVGSRDLSCGVPYCSSACCMIAAKQVSLSKQRSPEASITVYTMDVRAAGRGYEHYLADLRSRPGVFYRRSLISSVKLDPVTDNLHLQVAEAGTSHTEMADLVVLEVGMVVPPSVRGMAESAGVKLNPFGFVETAAASPLETSRHGVYAAGAFCGPKDAPTTIAEGTAAAARALMASGGMRHEMPGLPEPGEHVSQRGDYDAPVVGVFLDGDDTELTSVLDLKVLRDRVCRLPDVACVSLDTVPEMIGQAVHQYSLTSIIVGERSARGNGHHAVVIEGAPVTRIALGVEDVFAHKEQLEEARTKAYDMIQMAVEAARWAVPGPVKSDLPDLEVAVLGGGVAGLGAARVLSAMGIRTHLIECSDHLGGWRAESADAPWLRELITHVEADPQIIVHRSATLTSCQKRPGHLQLTLAETQGESAITVGALVAAIGSQEHRLPVYGLDQSATAISLRGFAALVAAWKARNTSPEIPRSIVMIQCAGTRNSAHQYCSKTCCSDALRNALALKKVASEISITVLYRDMMTPGLDEALYEQARREGIRFVRYTLESPPFQEGRALTVFDDVLRENVTIQADMLVLSTGIIPEGGTADLAHLLGVPLDKDGFFKPANVKSQTMDLSYPGLYLAGSAGGPATLDETIEQGMGAALRAALFLRRKLHPPLAAAQVNERICSGCGLCVQVCPAGARRVNEDRAVAEVDPWLCLGCGACVAVCPNGASSQALYETRGVLSLLEAALG